MDFRPIDVIRNFAIRQPIDPLSGGTFTAPASLSGLVWVEGTYFREGEAPTEPYYFKCTNKEDGSHGGSQS